MSQERLEISVRRVRPDEEEPDRLPLRWSTIQRLLAFTRPHYRQRNTLLVLCAIRACALPSLAWLVSYIIKNPVTQGNVEATFGWVAFFLAAVILADVALNWRIRLAQQTHGTPPHADAVVLPPTPSREFNQPHDFRHRSDAEWDSK